MNKLIALNGNNYILPDSETPESVTKRMLKVFNIAAGSLKTGEAAILLSHGDPIAFLIYILKTNSVLDPENIRKVQFPKKGQVTVAAIGTNEKPPTLYLLNPDIEGSAY
jgi:hypothetical protein